jgi:KaiC/GvpD/RAD55 family RecA-like ATPase
MKEENPSFSEFGKPFQEKLAFTILEDSQFANQIGEVIDYNFFELKYLRVFVKNIYNYKEKYGKYPSKSTFETILRTDLSKEPDHLAKQVRSYYAQFVTSGNTVDTEYVKNNAIEFCKKQKLKEAMIKSVELLKSSSFEEIRSLVDNAIKLGNNPDIGYLYDEHFEQRYEIKTRETVSTGWSVIDGMTRGGLAAGELGVVIAPTGAGKTHVLCHLGAAAVKEGKTVVHYSLELDDKTIGRRYDAAITGIPLDSLFARKEDVYDQIKDVDGKLVIKEYPTKSASPETLRNHLTKLRERGIDIGMIVVDYADLLRPISTRKEKREELETIYEELRAIAKENGCPCYTASQTNRSGLNAEVITMESISEAFNKCFVADFIFTVSRTIDDKRTNTGRIFVAKNRFGMDGVICPIMMDTSSVSIKVLEPTGETKQQIEEASAKKQMKRLKQKYGDYKDEKKKEKPTAKKIDEITKMNIKE